MSDIPDQPGPGTSDNVAEWPALVTRLRLAAAATTPPPDARAGQVGGFISAAPRKNANGDADMRPYRIGRRGPRPDRVTG